MSERDDNTGEATLCVKNVPLPTYNAWKAAAERQGLSLSAWVRTHLMVAARSKSRRMFIEPTR